MPLLDKRDIFWFGVVGFANGIAVLAIYAARSSWSPRWSRAIRWQRSVSRLRLAAPPTVAGVAILILAVAA